MAQRGREKRSESPLWGQLKGNFALKPGFDLSVFWKRWLSTGILHDNSVSRSAGGHRHSALDPDGGRLGGAAAHRQFRLDAIWTFSPGLVGAGSALWPVAGTGDRPHCPWGWATLLAPVFGVLDPGLRDRPLEAQMLRSRGDRYREYQLRTSQFFPLPPQMGVVKKGVVT